MNQPYPPAIAALVEALEKVDQRLGALERNDAVEQVAELLPAIHHGSTWAARISLPAKRSASSP